MKNCLGIVNTRLAFLRSILAPMILMVDKDGPLKWFMIAGADRKFVAAEARIEGDTIVVSNAQLTMPLAVRYAWDNYPEGCNLYNVAGLPAAPFRTDKW